MVYINHYSQLLYSFKLLYASNFYNFPYVIQGKFVQKHHANSYSFNAPFIRTVKRFPKEINASMHLFPLTILNCQNKVKNKKIFNTNFKDNLQMNDTSNGASNEECKTVNNLYYKVGKYSFNFIEIFKSEYNKCLDISTNKAILYNKLYKRSKLFSLYGKYLNDQKNISKNLLRELNKRLNRSIFNEIHSVDYESDNIESNIKYLSLITNKYVRYINQIRKFEPYSYIILQGTEQLRNIKTKYIYYCSLKHHFKKNLIFNLNFQNFLFNLFTGYKWPLLYNSNLCKRYINYMSMYIGNFLLLYSTIGAYYNKKYNINTRKKNINSLLQPNEELIFKKKIFNNESQIFWHLIFKNVFFNYLINRFMNTGKKEKMENIFFSILTTLKRRIKTQPISFMIKLFDLLLPVFDVSYIRKYGKMYSIPRLLHARRRLLILFTTLKTVLKEKKKIWYLKNRFVLELLQSNFKRSTFYNKIINFQRHVYSVRRNIYFTRKLQRKMKVFI